MKKFTVILFLSLLLTGTALANEQSKVEFAPYAVVLAERGPNYKNLSSDESMDLRMEVIGNLKKALQAGEIVIAGLVTDGSAEFIMIVRTDDEQAVRELLKNSPNVKNGNFKLRAYSWYAPAGLKLEPIPLER